MLTENTKIFSCHGAESHLYKTRTLVIVKDKDLLASKRTTCKRLRRAKPAGAHLTDGRSLPAILSSARSPPPHAWQRRHRTKATCRLDNMSPIMSFPAIPQFYVFPKLVARTPMAAHACVHARASRHRSYESHRSQQEPGDKMSFTSSMYTLESNSHVGQGDDYLQILNLKECSSL
ncbi:hypothetical protein V2G26_016475 [Clonostachys chloroleuca]